MNNPASIDPGLAAHDNPPDMQRRTEREQTPLLQTEKNADAPLLDLLSRLREILGQLDLPEYDDECALTRGQPGARVLDGLSEVLNRQQAAFLDALYDCLETAGVDSAHKLTLRLDGKARLCLGAPHPEEQAIAALLDARPDLATAFAEIALRSTLIRDLRSLQLGSSYSSIAEACMALQDASSRNGYQISLKGDMNHFYFSR